MDRVPTKFIVLKKPIATAEYSGGSSWGLAGIALGLYLIYAVGWTIASVGCATRTQDKREWCAVRTLPLCYSLTPFKQTKSASGLRNAHAFGRADIG